MRRTVWALSLLTSCAFSVSGCWHEYVAKLTLTDPDRESSLDAGGAVLAPSTIGYVRVISETTDAYETEIVFPGEYRDYIEVSETADKTQRSRWTAPIAVLGIVSIFDSRGVLGAVSPGVRFEIRFWANDDRGPHYRPTARLRLNKTDLRRPLSNADGFGAFVVHSAISRAKPTHSYSALDEGGRHLVLEGDANADGTPDARIVHTEAAGIAYYTLETPYSSEIIAKSGA